MKFSPIFISTNSFVYLQYTNNMENWKDIQGYEGLYQISDKGTVKGLERVLKYNATKTKIWKEKTIKTIVDHLGYCRVSLCKNGTVKPFKIHRLVATAFLSGEGHVNHIDGNKLNNNVSNLEFCTPKENNWHSFVSGLRPKKYHRTIICNETNETFKNQSALARHVGLSQPMVSAHLRGVTKHIKKLTYKYL